MKKQKAPTSCVKSLQKAISFYLVLTAFIWLLCIQGKTKVDLGRRDMTYVLGLICMRRRSEPTV